MKNTWSVKKKAVLSSVILALLMIFSLTIVIVAIFTGIFMKLENDYSEKNVKRVEEAYKYLVSNSLIKITDWANWNDTYEFVSDLNEDFIVSNLGSSSLSNLNINEMLFFDEEGTLVYATATDETINNEPNFPKDVEKLLVGSDILEKLKNDISATELIKTDDGILFFVGHQILKSDGSGPHRGYIVFGRYLGGWLAEDLTKIVQLPIILDMDGVIDEKLDFKNIIADKKMHRHYELDVRDSEQNISFRIEMDRDMWFGGLKSMLYLLVASFVVIVIATTLNYFIFYKSFLADLLRFNTDVSSIINNIDSSILKKYGQNLEIDELRDNVNLLLQKINDSRKEVIKNSENLSKTNKLMVGRELAMAELKKTIEDLKKRII